MPVLTRHSLGKGSAYYLGSDAEAAFLDDFYGSLAQTYGLQPALAVPEGVEVSVRYKDHQALLFVLNHHPETVEIDLGDRHFNDLLNREPVHTKLVIEGYGVHLLAEQPISEQIEVNG
jgi:beta-galactosidase